MRRHLLHVIVLLLLLLLVLGVIGVAVKVAHAENHQGQLGLPADHLTFMQHVLRATILKSRWEKDGKCITGLKISQYVFSTCVECFDITSLKIGRTIRNF